jgi:transposase
MVTYIGVDISSDKLHIAYQVGEQWITTEIRNELSTIDDWIVQMPSNIHVVFEYTGTYSSRLAYCLSLSERIFSIVTPSQSKGFADTLKNQAKTDKQDAKMLCLFGSKMQPEKTELIDEELHKKRQLYRHYNSLKSQKQAIDNQVHALSFDPRANQNVVASLHNLIEFYQMQLDDFDKQLFDINPDDFASIQQQLMTIKGIGKITATHLIIATNGFKNFSSAKKFAKFIGLAPSVKQSGTSVNKRGKIPRTAFGICRATLYSAARSAARYNTDCNQLYIRLRAKGKSYKTALIAVAHKLIRQAFAIVKNQTTFDNNFCFAK